MKIARFKNPVSYRSFILFLLLTVLPLNISHAENNHSNDLTGPGFTDPAYKQEMPAEWIEKPVKYYQEAIGADLTVTLDGQLYHAWEPLIKDYAKEHKLNIVITHGTCGLSAGKLINKAVDVSAFCCPPGKTDRLPGLKFHTLGIAAIALLVNPDNPVENITIDQARNIFMGKLYRWSSLLPAENSKKNNLRIQPIGRLHCKLRPGHWRLLLDNEDLFSPALFEVGAIPDMITQVAINPGAIGYEILWTSRYYSDKADLKFLKVNGYSPDNSSDLMSANYPLYRVYSFTTWEDNNVSKPHANKLVDYLTRKTEHLDPKYNFVPTSLLKKAGWKFKGNELVGKPE